MLLHVEENPKCLGQRARLRVARGANPGIGDRDQSMNNAEVARVLLPQLHGEFWRPSTNADSQECNFPRGFREEKSCPSHKSAISASMTCRAYSSSLANCTSQGEVCNLMLGFLPWEPCTKPCSHFVWRSNWCIEDPPPRAKDVSGMGSGVHRGVARTNHRKGDQCSSPLACQAQEHRQPQRVAKRFQKKTWVLQDRGYLTGTLGESWWENLKLNWLRFVYPASPFKSKHDLFLVQFFLKPRLDLSNKISCALVLNPWRRPNLAMREHPAKNSTRSRLKPRPPSSASSSRNHDANKIKHRKSLGQQVVPYSWPYRSKELAVGADPLVKTKSML